MITHLIAPAAAAAVFLCLEQKEELVVGSLAFVTTSKLHYPARLLLMDFRYGGLWVRGEAARSG